MRNLGSLGVGAVGGAEGVYPDENLTEARDEHVNILAEMMAPWRPRVVWSISAFP